MKQLPLLFKVNGKRCLIVGAGRIGTRRAKVIARAQAVINIVSITATDSIKEIAGQSGGIVRLGAWEPADIHSDYQFVIAATDDGAVNGSIAKQCNELGIPVNVVTDSHASDFAFPSIIDRDPITIAISSGSASPILARLLGERIDALIPSGYGRLAALVGKYRDKVRRSIKDPVRRKMFWEKALMGNIAESIFSGNPEHAEKLLVHTLDHAEALIDHGEVYLIGAGPGDPDLLTFRAFRLLQQSEVVLFDRLVSEKILAQIHPDVEMIYVGKQRSNHSVPQQNINQLLVDYAQSGKRVARLKGGDPFIFGRGGEEIELLARNNIPFQVVPGVTAAAGCASYSGIPLTHRDHAQSVRFVTGQLKDGSVDLPWHQLVAPGQTVVIYMGLKGLPIISNQLMHHGMAPDTPAALIEQGTTLNQKVYCSTIKQLPQMIENLTVTPPTLLIIGSVVTLHHSLSWFQQSQDFS